MQSKKISLPIRIQNFEDGFHSDPMYLNVCIKEFIDMPMTSYFKDNTLIQKRVQLSLDISDDDLNNTTVGDMLVKLKESKEKMDNSTFIIIVKLMLEQFYEINIKADKKSKELKYVG